MERDSISRGLPLMPWRFRLVERQRGYMLFRSDQRQDSGTARRTGSKEKELPEVIARQLAPVG